MSVRLAVAGATGRMGQAVIAVASEREDCEVVLAVNRDPDLDRVGSVPVAPASDLVERLREADPDVLVEFTGPESAVEYAARCEESGVAFLSGTTGLSEQQEARIREAGTSIPVLRASNFSRGVAVLESLVREAVATLPDYDVEVVEAHHAGKRDAPSGTAGDLLDAVDEARGREHDRIHGREGDSLRSDGDVGVHSIRGGSVTGDHAVVLAGEGESVRVEHRAGDRRAFAAGAVESALELAGMDPGSHDLREVRP